MKCFLSLCIKLQLQVVFAQKWQLSQTDETADTSSKEAKKKIYQTIEFFKASGAFGFVTGA